MKSEVVKCLRQAARYSYKFKICTCDVLRAKCYPMTETNFTERFPVEVRMEAKRFFEELYEADARVGAVVPDYAYMWWGSPRIQQKSHQARILAILLAAEAYEPPVQNPQEASNG